MEYTKEINKIVEGINFTNKTVKPTKKYKKVCEYCGKEFETNRENKKYCSAACRNSYHVEKYQQKAKVKVEQETVNITKLASVNFNNEIVITTKTLAQVYECDTNNIKKNFNINEDKFIEGKHYYELKGDELKNFKMLVTKSNQPLYEEIKFAPKLYLWTKRGASRHCKMLGTDKAWDMFESLEENYFNPQIQQISQEDKAWLELKHSQQDENAQYLINVTTQKLAIEFNKTLAKEIDGEGRRITLTELADKLSQITGFKIESINITNFLVYKGYFTKEQFPRRGSFIVNGVVIGRLERNYHRQPTEKFLTEFANKGLSLTKPADERGKIVWEFTNKFEKYFEQTFLEEFIYYVQNTEKGWE